MPSLSASYQHSWSRSWRHTRLLARNAVTASVAYSGPFPFSSRSRSLVSEALSVDSSNRSSGTSNLRQPSVEVLPPGHSSASAVIARSAVARTTVWRIVRANVRAERTSQRSWRRSAPVTGYPSWTSANQLFLQPCLKLLFRDRLLLQSPFVPTAVDHGMPFVEEFKHRRIHPLGPRPSTRHTDGTIQLMH